MALDEKNMSITDEMLREKVAALMNECVREFLTKRGFNPRDLADAISWELVGTGMILYEEYKYGVQGLFQALQDHLFPLRQARLDGEVIKPSDVLPRGMLELARVRRDAVYHLQWALRTLPKLKDKPEDVPRYREAMAFIESLGDEDKPCHVCKAKPGEQGEWFCSACACVNCTWKRGKLQEFCPEHRNEASAWHCQHCAVWFNKDLTHCPACGFPND